MASTEGNSSSNNTEEVPPTPIGRRSPELTLESLSELISRLLDEKLATRAPSPYAASPFQIHTPAPRRTSSLFVPGTNIPTAPELATETATTPAVNIIYADKEIKEEDKMQVLSLNAVMMFKKKVDCINASSVVKIKLQRYISNKAMQNIWNWESYKKTEYTWTGSYESLFTLEHNQFMKILARRLRPTSHTEYCAVLASCLHKLKAPSDFTLASSNYDQILFQQVADFFTIVKEVDEFVRHDATPAELEYLPRLEYGREGSRHGFGVFGIAIASLDRFAEDYKRLIGIDVLRACTTMDEFMDKATAVNHELARRSEKNRIDRTDLQPKLSFKAIGELIASARAPTTELPKRKPPSNNVLKPYFEVCERRHSVANDGDEDGDSEAGEEYSPVFPDIEDTDANVGQLQLVNTYKAKPPERVLPCYQHFDGNCTAGASCVYSHDPSVLAAYGKDQLKRLVRSKYVTADDITNASKEKSQNVTRTPPTQRTQDARHLPSGRGAGNLRILSRPSDAVQQEEKEPTQG